MPTRSKPLHDVLELRGLAAGDRDAGLARALAQAGADGIEHGGVGALDRDVVDQRERACAPTQIMSLTFMATQSMPMVSYLPIMSAMMVFEPTPSVQSASPTPSSSMTLAK